MTFLPGLSTKPIFWGLIHEVYYISHKKINPSCQRKSFWTKHVQLFISNNFTPFYFLNEIQSISYHIINIFRNKHFHLQSKHCFTAGLANIMIASIWNKPYSMLHCYTIVGAIFKTSVVLYIYFNDLWPFHWPLLWWYNSTCPLLGLFYKSCHYLHWYHCLFCRSFKFAPSFSLYLCC